MFALRLVEFRAKAASRPRHEAEMLLVHPPGFNGWVPLNYSGCEGPGERCKHAAALTAGAAHRIPVPKEAAGQMQAKGLNCSLPPSPKPVVWVSYQTLVSAGRKRGKRVLMTQGPGSTSGQDC